MSLLVKPTSTSKLSRLLSKFLSMETFFAVIYALDQAASHVKLVLEVNKPFSTCYRTVCIWKKELLGGFNAGEQVIITFFKKLFIQLIHSSR